MPLTSAFSDLHFSLYQRELTDHSVKQKTRKNYDPVRYLHIGIYFHLNQFTRSITGVEMDTPEAEQRPLKYRLLD